MRRILTFLILIAFATTIFSQRVSQIPAKYVVAKRESEDVTRYHRQNTKDIRALGDIIYEEHFAGVMPAGWSSSNTIAFQWVWTDTGPAGVTPGADEEIESTTKVNGWMMYDSDAGPGGSYDAKLTSPSWDFSAHSSVMVSFEEFFRKWDSPGPNLVYLEVSNDSINWTSFEFHSEYFTKDQTPNPTTTVVNITSIAAGQSQVWVRFRMTGDWDYNWQIDDLIFAEASDNDLRIWDIWPCFMYTNGGFMSKLPFDQPHRAFFGVEVLNFGNNDAHNVVFDVDFKDSWNTSVYNAQYDTIILESAIDNVPDSFGIDLANPFIWNTLNMGFYDLVYTVSSDSIDEDPASATRTYIFESTDTVFARDNGDTTTRWGTSPQSWSSGGTNGDEFGVTFSLENVNPVEAGSISFFLHPDSEWGAIIGGRLYLSDGLGGWDLVLETNLYEILSTDTGKWVTLPFNKDGFSEMLIAGYYLVNLVFEDYAGTTILIAEDRSLYRDVNETLWSFASGGGPIGAISNYCKVPFIRLNLAWRGTVNTETVANSDKFNMYPNPTTGMLHFGGVENAKVQICNMTGELIEEFNNVSTSIDLSEFDNGNYIVKVISDSCITTKKLTLIK
ncbi:MAG: T9SS type A sorting domain-containing protein [Bacteroidota bacterium]